MIDKTIPVAIYFQIVNNLKKKIYAGEHLPGEKLPTEKELAKQYDVSRLTVRNALEVLIKEHFVYSLRGSGTYVTDADQWKPKPLAEEHFDKWLDERVEAQLKVHEYAMISNSEAIKEKLQNPEDKFVLRIGGVDCYFEHPIIFHHWYIPYDLGAKIPVGGLDEGPFLPQFEEFTEVRIKKGTRELYPGRASSIEAEFLRIKEGDLVLIGEAVYYNHADRRIIYAVTKSIEDFRYKIRIVRE